MLKILIGVYIFLSSIVFAAVRYPFVDAKQEAQFIHLTKELRCMVCSHQSLSESNAPFAIDIKELIANKIRHGDSDKDIEEKEEREKKEKEERDLKKDKKLD